MAGVQGVPMLGHERLQGGDETGKIGGKSIGELKLPR